MTTFNQTHPELLAGEVFLTNGIYDNPTKGVGWETARVGNVAYDRRGRQIFGQQFRPVFVRREELPADVLAILECDILCQSARREDGNNQ